MVNHQATATRSKVQQESGNKNKFVSAKTYVSYNFKSTCASDVLPRDDVIMTPSQHGTGAPAVSEDVLA